MSILTGLMQLSSCKTLGRNHLSIKMMSTIRNTVPIQLFYNDIYEVPLPPNHRFPMQKYRLVRETLQKEYQNNPLVVFTPAPLASKEELASTHCPIYIEKYFTGNMTDLEVRKTGFPWTREQVQRSASTVGGTVAAMRTVLSSSARISGLIAGGTHHAFYDYGEGFCIFNDIAVAANLALKEYSDQIKQVLIIDLDVHQGNGNAELFHTNPNVFTFSMHCKENIFSKKRFSNLDIELEAGTTNEAYLESLETWIPHLFGHIKPDLVFFQAGVDISDHDKLGKLAVSRQGIQQRNAMVFQALWDYQVKGVVTMGGGYPKDLNPHSDAFQHIINCHADVYKNCINFFSQSID